MQKYSALFNLLDNFKDICFVLLKKTDNESTHFIHTWTVSINLILLMLKIFDIPSLIFVTYLFVLHFY